MKESLEADLDKDYGPAGVTVYELQQYADHSLGGMEAPYWGRVNWPRPRPHNEAAAIYDLQRLQTSGQFRVVKKTVIQEVIAVLGDVEAVIAVGEAGV